MRCFWQNHPLSYFFFLKIFFPKKRQVGKPQSAVNQTSVLYYAFILWYQEVNVQIYDCERIDVVCADCKARFAKIKANTKGKYTKYCKSSTCILNPVSVLPLIPTRIYKKWNLEEYHFISIICKYHFIFLFTSCKYEKDNWFEDKQRHWVNFCKSKVVHYTGRL